MKRAVLLATLIFAPLTAAAQTPAYTIGADSGGDTPTLEKAAQCVALYSWDGETNKARGRASTLSDARYAAWLAWLTAADAKASERTVASLPETRETLRVEFVSANNPGQAFAAQSASCMQYEVKPTP